LIEKVLSEYQTNALEPNRGGRPKSQAPTPDWKGNGKVTTSTGVTLKCEIDTKGFLIRFKGKGIAADTIETIMMDIRDKLEKADPSQQ
jgi:ParB family chromosome partitioning protein